MNYGKSKQSSARSFANGRYIILSQIGSGGMADVWRVLDTKFEIERAIKVLRTIQHAYSFETFSNQHNSEGNQVKRLAKEARVTMQILHPNIITIFDTFEENNCLHLVMEKCSGSLDSWVIHNGKMPVNLALQITIQILQGLNKSHSLEIVHRDIKPHNILVSEDGVIKVSDFGLALSPFGTESITRTNAILGSIQFMSPEQRNSPLSVNHRTDIYSVAKTLVWLLEGDGLGDLYVPEVLQILKEKYSEDLVSIIEKAGKINPEERYQSVRDMKQDVEQALSILPACSVSLCGLQLEEILIEDLEPLWSDTGNSINKDISSTMKAPPLLYWSIGLILLLLLSLVVRSFSPEINLLPENNIQVSKETTFIQKVETYSQCPNAPQEYQDLIRLGPRVTTNHRLYDLDKDGLTDAFFVNLLDESISIYWGNANFSFDNPEEIPFGRSIASPLFSDIDHDGVEDIVGFHFQKNEISIQKGLQNRKFREVMMNGRDIMLQDPSPIRGAFHDLNEDGWEDLLFVSNLDEQGREELIIRLNAQRGLDYIIQNIPNTEEEPLKWHQKIQKYNYKIFIGEHEPIVYWIEGDNLMQQRVLPNGLLTQKDVLQKGMLDSQIVNISLHNKSDAVYIYTAQNQILQWSQGKKPCLLIPSIELERPATISFGDWNNDELTDYLTFDSCWYCTSNHLLHLGMN